MDAITDSVAQMSQMFLQKLAEFEDRQQKLLSPSSSGPASTLEADFASFKTFILSALRALQSQVELLRRETDNLEMHTRRKILLLHGVPDSKDEDTAAVVVKTMAERLKLSDFQATDISRCHRMGKLTSGRPRPILIKLSDVRVRAKIWSSKTSLKGTGISVSEFLTKARHDAFMAARQRFGVTKCWTRDGFVYVLDSGGERHRVSSIVELDGLGKQTANVPVAPKASAVLVKEPAAARSKRAVTAAKK